MKVTDIIIWILFIISIAVGLWYLFGSSPTFEQTILFFIITALFTIEVKVARIGTELKFLNKRFYNLEKSFIKLANDFKESRK